MTEHSQQGKKHVPKLPGNHNAPKSLYILPLFSKWYCSVAVGLADAEERAGVEVGVWLLEGLPASSAHHEEGP